MDDIQLLDAVERYIRGEMNPDERLHFENLRKTNADVDQLVVEHTLFLQQMNRFGEWQQFKSTLNEVHSNLASEGKIDTARQKGTSKIVYLWNRYKRVTAIAASIAGITAIAISGLVWSVSPKPPSASQVQELNKKINESNKQTGDKLSKLEEKLDDIANKPTITYKTVGTGFLIDGKGLMVTNAHVIKKSNNISVFNSRGKKFNAIVLKLDFARDVAIIKIDDENFKPFASLPYAIRRGASDIAEPIFTLGFPRDSIVYDEGYLSSRTGHNGDTLSCQISIPANPGNSGGPIFNESGEVIGILRSKETDAVSTVFAIQSKYIFKAVEDLKKNKLYEAVKLPVKSSLISLNRKQQVKKIQEYVFMVKGD